MRLRVLARLSPLVLGGCIQIGPHAAPPAVTNVAAQAVQQGRAVITFEVGWMAVNLRQVKILVKVSNPGLVRSNTFYLDATMDGMYAAKGSARLLFNMLPRQVHDHEVDYRLVDGAQAGSVTIHVRPTHNGSPQWSHTLHFQATDKGPQLVGR